MRWWQIRRPCLFVLQVWLSYQLLTANHPKGCVNNLLPNSNDQNPSFARGEMLSWSTLVHFPTVSLIHRLSSLLQKSRSAPICATIPGNIFRVGDMSQLLGRRKVDKAINILFRASKVVLCGDVREWVTMAMMHQMIIGVSFNWPSLFSVSKWKRAAALQGCWYMKFLLGFTFGRLIADNLLILFTTENGVNSQRQPKFHF